MGACPPSRAMVGKFFNHLGKTTRYWYNMLMTSHISTSAQWLRKLTQSKALREAIAVQEIEGNPLTSREIAMFEDFEARGLSPEQCRDEIYEYLFQQHGIPKP